MLNTLNTRLLLVLFAVYSVSIFSQNSIKLVVLHTNDTHSQVEPTEKSSSQFSDMGGYARRMGVVANVRAIEPNVLLLDAGDFSQGTPYFNFFNGRVEIDAMNRMKYDAVTIGNHEFDNGIDTLALILRDAKFPVLSSNYQFDNNTLRNLVSPYLILKRSGLRIGVLTANVDPKGLVFENNYKGLTYSDALKTAITLSAFLKNEKKCDIIICLSHLGVQHDYEIARHSIYIDIIIGGHSHSLLENIKQKNAVGKDVIISQMGKGGLYLGKVELLIEKR